MIRIATRIFSLALLTSVAVAAMAQDVKITGVPFANPKSGHPDNVISPGFKLVVIA